MAEQDQARTALPEQTPTRSDSVSTLNEPHSVPIIDDLSSILSINIDESTYCQMVDGMSFANALEEVTVTSIH